MKQKAAFIDRDGTLIEEVNYLSRVQDLKLFPFTTNAISTLKQEGFRVIVVTNQSGIGRGIFDEASMNAVHEELQRRLAGSIDAFYFCPHLPCDGCNCRKPSLGMIEMAMRDFEIDLDKSWMIGDKTIDIETGFNAGTGTALVSTGYGASHIHKLERRPDIFAENLLEAVKKIVNKAEAG